MNRSATSAPPRWSLTLGAVLAVGCGRFQVEAAIDAVAASDAAAELDMVDAADRSYPMTVLADHPIAYWRLGDIASQAVDGSGNRNHGAYSDSGVIRGVPGAIANDPDTAAQFDGLKGFVSIGVGFDFPDNASWSAELWFKPVIVDQIYRHLFTKEHRIDPRHGISVSVHDPEGLQTERFVDGIQTIARFPLLGDGNFVHCVMTYDGTATRLFVNGQLRDQVLDTRPMPAVIEAALIGVARVEEGTYFGGAIDEVAVYDAALPAARVEAHFAAGTGTQ